MPVRTAMIDFLSPRLKLVNPACATLETARPATIAAVTHPFRNERIIIELPPGGSVANVMRTLGVDPTRPARVFIDDRIVTLEQRDGIFLKPGQTLTIRVVPAGGSNSKNTEILTIVVAAIAAVATYGATSALVANSAFFASATQAGGSDLLASAALAGIQGAVDESVKFLGGLAINALIPPPKTPAVRLSSTPQSYTVSGGANSAAAFSVIPKIYGARRIFPQYAASPYTELVGFDQYLRMLFLLGYGPLDISQIQIGDTAIEDYEDVEWELRAGFTDDAPSRLYPGSVVETDLSIQLSKTVQNARPSGAGTWSNTQTSGPLTLTDELSVYNAFP
jgi:predicted phage tail protein